VIKKHKIVLTLVQASGVIVKPDIEVTVVPVKVRNLHDYVKRLVGLQRPNYSVLTISPQHFIQTLSSLMHR
jgi:hypothetical protein